MIIYSLIVSWKKVNQKFLPIQLTDSMLLRASWRGFFSWEETSHHNAFKIFLLLPVQQQRFSPIALIHLQSNTVHISVLRSFASLPLIYLA